MIWQPWFNGTGLAKLTYITLVYPTIPATDGLFDGSTVNAEVVMIAGCVT